MRSARNRGFSLAWIFAAVLFAAPGWASSQKQKVADTTSGIKGTVMLHNTCGGPVRKNNPNCAPRPYQGELAVKRSPDGATVATVASDGRGKFLIAVPPGRYFITQAGAAMYPRIHSPEIVVLKNKFTSVEVEADTGMR